MRAYRKVDERYELKIEGGRLILLGVGGLLTLVLVFLVGVLVGKGLRGEGAVSVTPGTAPATAVPTTPVAPVPSKPQYTFYDDLKKPDRPEAPVAPAKPDVSGATAETPIPVPGPVAVSPAPPAQTQPPPAVAAPAHAKVPEAPRPAPSPPAKPAPGPPVALFTVQVGSFKDRASADDQMRRIAAQGVTAQVIPVSVEGRTWYRVQVGRFETRAEAESHYQKKLRPKAVQGFVTPR